LCFDNNTVVLIIGILAAIAIPNYIGQQKEAKDFAAMPQLSTAATSQELYHVPREVGRLRRQHDRLRSLRFQGGQLVKVVAAVASTYCMQAPGSTNTFKMTQDTGLPVPGTC
jgi:type IV pilus assembly protein PilA